MVTAENVSRRVERQLRAALMWGGVLLTVGTPVRAQVTSNSPAPVRRVDVRPRWPWPGYTGEGRKAIARADSCPVRLSVPEDLAVVAATPNEALPYISLEEDDGERRRWGWTPQDADRQPLLDTLRARVVGVGCVGSLMEPPLRPYVVLDVGRIVRLDIDGKFYYVARSEIALQLSVQLDNAGTREPEWRRVTPYNTVGLFVPTPRGLESLVGLVTYDTTLLPSGCVGNQVGYGFRSYRDLTRIVRGECRHGIVLTSVDLVPHGVLDSLRRLTLDSLVHLRQAADSVRRSAEEASAMRERQDAERRRRALRARGWARAVIDAIMRRTVLEGMTKAQVRESLGEGELERQFRRRDGVVVESMQYAGCTVVFGNGRATGWTGPLCVGGE